MVERDKYAFSRYAAYMTYLPNFLTISRMVLVAPFVGLFYLPDAQAAALATFGIFILAAVTDFFDGWLARRLGVASQFGRIFDPIADKLLVTAALIMLALRNIDAELTIISIPYGPLTIPVIAILCRELLISGLREGLAGKFTLPVNRLGKLKTACQMIAVALLLGGPALASFSDPEWSNGEGKGIALVTFVLVIIGQILIWAAAVLSWLSAAIYIHSVSRQLRLPEE